MSHSNASIAAGGGGPKFHQDDPDLPIYSTSPSSYSQRDIVHLLLEVSSEHVCAKKPTRVSKNCCFIVDLSKLSHMKDVTADDNGSYIQHGSPEEHCHVLVENGKIVDMVIKRSTPVDSEDLHALGMEESEHYVLHRKYGKLKASPDFRRMVAFLTKPNTSGNGDYHCYCLIQYRFDNEEHKLPAMPHGNSKYSRPYRCTQFSTRAAIKRSASSSQPSEVVARLRAEKGGFLMSESSSELPRNSKQVSNLRSTSQMKAESLFKSISKKDDLLAIMERCKNSQNPFVREVTAAPEPTCILATDQQLLDVKRFCTLSRPSNSILGIDPTFSLGDFFVTCTVYRHIGVENRTTRRNLLFNGPMFIHQRKQYTTYHRFAAGLLRLVPELKHLKAFGTDGETNLYTAFQNIFTEADHLRCFVHMKRNVKEKLSEVSVSQEVANQYMFDIFGKVVNGIYTGGLVDASSPEEFDELLEQLKDLWNQRELPFVPQGSQPQFYSWFKKNKVPEIKSSTLAVIRSANGLGDPPIPFTTNDNETANSLIKQKVRHIKNNLPDFVDKMEEFVRDQEARVHEAIVGDGDYQLMGEFVQFKVGDKWWTMSSKQRKRLVQRMSTHHPVSHVGCTIPDDSRMFNLDDDPFQIAKKCSEITSLPGGMLRSVCQKASRLIKDNMVVPVPGSQDKMIVSSSDTVYVVTRNTQGNVKCEKTKCAGYSTYSICSHCIAAAHCLNALQDFISYLNRVHVSPSIDSLAHFGLPSGAGRKDSKGKRKRPSYATPLREIANFVPANTAIANRYSTTSSNLYPAVAASATANYSTSDPIVHQLPTITTSIPQTIHQLVPVDTSQSTEVPVLEPPIATVPVHQSVTANISESNQTSICQMPTITTSNPQETNVQQSVSANTHTTDSSSTVNQLPTVTTSSYSSTTVQQSVSANISHTTEALVHQVPTITTSSQQVHSVLQSVSANISHSNKASIHQLPTITISSPQVQPAQQPASDSANIPNSTDSLHHLSPINYSSPQDTTLQYSVASHTNSAQMPQQPSPSIILNTLQTRTHNVSPPISQRQLTVKMLNSRIKVCAGCRLPFVQQLTAGLCLATEDTIGITLGSGHQFSKMTTIHFHPFPSCIQRRFQSAYQVILPPEVSLTCAQRHLLEKYFSV